MLLRWDVGKAFVLYEDKDGGKRRPVLVINVNTEECITFKITKNVTRESELEYKIIRWRDAGLDFPSCVRLEHKVYFSDFDNVVKIGRLLKEDIDNIKILCEKFDIKLDEKLIQSASDKALQQNIKTEIDSGKSPKQAAAIAYSILRKNESMNDKQELLRSMAYEDVEYDQVFDRGDFDTFREMMADQGYLISEQDLEDYYKYVDEATGFTESIESNICVICNQEYTGLGNNAEPVAKGQCCDKCNMEKVVPARLSQAQGLKESNDTMEQRFQQFKKDVADDNIGGQFGYDWYEDIVNNAYGDALAEYDDVELEPSVQAGRGGIFAYIDGHDCGYVQDFEAECEELYKLACESDTYEEFKQSVQGYVDRLVEYACEQLPDEEENLDESLDTARIKAQELRKNSDAEVIFYAYRDKKGNLVELEPEELTMDEYQERVKQITDEQTKLSDKDPRGNRYGHERDMMFYALYKRAVTEGLDDDIDSMDARATEFEKLSKDSFDRGNEEGGYYYKELADEIRREMDMKLATRSHSIEEDMNGEYVVMGVTTAGNKVYYNADTREWLDKADDATIFTDMDIARDTWSVVTNNGRKLPDGFRRIFVPNYNKQTMNESSETKWNMGSNKVVPFGSDEHLKLIDLAQMLEDNSPNGYKYEVKQTYEDFGANMQWTTIICSDRRGDTWQVLNTKEWLDLANGKSVEEVYNEVVNGQYFQDKEKDYDDMNMGEIFDSLD